MQIEKRQDSMLESSLNITDMYMTVLASLSMGDRRDLISKLTDSLRKETVQVAPPLDLRTCFSGDWSGVSAADLRNNITR